MEYKYRIYDVEFDLLPMEEGVARGAISAMWEAWDEKGDSLGKGKVSRTFRADETEFTSGYGGVQLRELFHQEISDGLDRLYTRRQMYSFLRDLYVDLMKEPENVKGVREHEPSMQTKIWMRDSGIPIGFQFNEEQADDHT